MGLPGLLDNLTKARIIFVAIHLILNARYNTRIHARIPCHFILILNLILPLQRLKEKWQARIGRVADNQDLYLGSYRKRFIVLLLSVRCMSNIT